MSLINDALKKAQRQRATGREAPPPPPLGTRGRGRLAKRKAPMPAKALVGLVLVSVIVMILVVGVVIWVLRPPAADEIIIARPVATRPPPEPTPTEAPDKSTASGISSDNNVPEIKITPDDTPPVENLFALPPIFDDKHVAPATAPSPDDASTPAMMPPPKAPAPPRAVQPDPAVYALVDTFQVAGIRISETDPKVLMNGRVFRLNEIVDRDSGLKLTHVSSSQLTFTDVRGATYLRNF